MSIPSTRSAYHALLRNHFASFIAQSFMAANPGTPFLPNWHIDLIAEYLEAARHGEIRRLIINMPPRALKSLCVSVAWPAWILGHTPEARIIAASYAQGLSLKHSLDCRALMQQGWYRAMFPGVRLAPDQNEKHKFMTTARGFRLAASAGGMLTGEGGNFLILDDPLSPLQAASRHERMQANAWFEHTFASRLDDKRHGVMVLVMQRLHAEDLSGYLLAKGGWEHLCLPALAEDDETVGYGDVWHARRAGAPLHHAREDEHVLARAQQEMGSHAFSAQYQQRPVPEAGAMIRREWLLRHEAPPPLPERIVQSWDTAIKSGSKHDASCCLTMAEHAGVSYVLEARAWRMEYPDLKRKVVSQAEAFSPQVILMEDKASGQQLLQDLRRDTTLPLVPVMPRADKLTRMAAVSALIEGGRLSLPRQAPWLAALEEELLSFPSGAHDDQADALSQYLGWLRDRSCLAPNMRYL